MEPGSSRKLTIALGVIVVLAILFGLAISELGPRGRLSGYQLSKQQIFDSIKPGEDHVRLIEKLGPIHTIHLISPNSSLLPFTERIRKNTPEKVVDWHGAEPWFSSFVEQSDPPRIAYYLVWMNGSNWYYFLGLDIEGRPLTKGEGHS